MLAFDAHSRSKTMVGSTWHDFVTGLEGAAFVCEVGLIVAEVVRTMSGEAKQRAPHGRVAAGDLTDLTFCAKGASSSGSCSDVGARFAQGCQWACERLFPCCVAERAVYTCSAPGATDQ